MPIPTVTNTSIARGSCPWLGNSSMNSSLPRRRPKGKIRRNVDADYYGFNRDEDDGTKEVESFRNVERAGEEGALRVGHRLLVSG